MFFELVKRNSRRSRKENGIFFVSLIISVIAFYIILSLKNQDVIQFLLTMESDAVNRIFKLIPVLYGMSLFILFFLIYFAGRYQLERRSHELGIYQMMGMRRGRLFALLMLEDLISSIAALLVGIPVAVLLSELISLVTSKLVGMGILDHQTSFSVSAVLWTAVGFLFIKMTAYLILSGSVAGKEIQGLLNDTGEDEKKEVSKNRAAMRFTTGMLLLAGAYFCAIAGNAWGNLLSMTATVIFGTTGTFLLFQGICTCLELRMGKQEKCRNLELFTYRQLQETVMSKANALAVVSLLILLSLCCFGYGISMGWEAKGKEIHSIDYTFTGEEAEIRNVLRSPELLPYLELLSEMRISSFSTWEENGNTIDINGLLTAVEHQEDNEKDILLHNLSYLSDSIYLISESGYNDILAGAGKPLLQLAGNQAAFYSDLDFTYGKMYDILSGALQEHPSVTLNGTKFQLTAALCQNNFVVDRQITLSYGLIVADEVFLKLVKGTYSSYWNASIYEEVKEEQGLMQAIVSVNKLLDGTGICYESYLQNIGRQLFYIVCGSYISLYLAVIFLLVANTVLAVQFLMEQRKSGRRYRILVHLGCGYPMLCRSARKQIQWYFGIPVLVAVISSIFGIRSLFTGLLSSEMQGKTDQLTIFACVAVFFLGVVEYLYTRAVMRASDLHIRELMKPEREES